MGIFERGIKGVAKLDPSVSLLLGIYIAAQATIHSWQLLNKY